MSISEEELKKTEDKRTRSKRNVNYNEETNSEDEKDWLLPEDESSNHEVEEKYKPFHSNFNDYNHRQSQNQ